MSHAEESVHAVIRRRAAASAAVVFDLDGVVREFGPATTQTVAAEVGLEPQEFLALAFAEDLLEPVITGRRTFAAWCGLIRDELVARGAAAATAEGAVRSWVADRGTPVAETAALMAELQASGTAVFVFTNGSDNIPAELRQIGLGHLVDVVLNSAVLGFRKPHPEAYAAAHAALETHLRRSIDRPDVLFTDDRISNVEGAARFGWQAVHFDAGVATDV
ncbi:HAD family hydrolase [Ornithinimicrobium faecis]|uniref:HAD family hydrolase n=1 Tax=Ornithinimicrobium faecis TaxID=2934158 RepID=UPI002118350D|nr:HAD family hydrolase [Ornithinimicrobium sp. HY1745]